jgi:hypothetical protein
MIINEGTNMRGRSDEGTFLSPETEFGRPGKSSELVSTTLHLAVESQNFSEFTRADY